MIKKEKTLLLVFFFRHLIKSILILIPLFGLHSLFVVWVFYHKNQGHTIWYYIAVIFKAIFGDLQVIQREINCVYCKRKSFICFFFFKGFFTSLIYFYFNTEIRHEVFRQVQRTLLRHDTVRRSSAGETLSTRLSVFRISLNRRRQSSIPNRHDRRRTTMPTTLPSVSKKHRNHCRKFLISICPCLFKNSKPITRDRSRGQFPTEPINPNEISPIIQTNLTPIDDLGGQTSSLIIPTDTTKDAFDNEGLTCETLLTKNTHESNDDDDVLSDENDVTFHHTSFNGEQNSLIFNPTPSAIRKANSKDNVRHRSRSDEHRFKELTMDDIEENKPLR